MDPMDHLDLSENPTQASFEKLIGEKLFAQLSVELGGRRLYIPTVSGPNSPLAVCIGLDEAKKISDIYGGFYFEVPLRAGTRARIIEEFQAGTPKARIAAKLRCSRRGVYNVLENHFNKEQLSLFDQP